ncbi:MAG: hypothetical protein WCG16_14155 [Methylococcales bacterium]
MKKYDYLVSIEKWMSLTNIVATYFIAIGFKLTEGVSDSKVLWAIWTSVVVLVCTESLKRNIVISRIEEDVKIIKESKVVEIIRLDDRGHMYETCTRLIKTSKEVVDTTWGKSNKSDTTIQQDCVFKESKEAYLKAVDNALDFNGITYSSISASSSSPQQKTSNNKIVRVLKNDLDLPWIEFMVFDQKSIVFSRAHSGSGGAKYYLIHDSKIATLFKSFFDDMWAQLDDNNK